MAVVDSRTAGMSSQAPTAEADPRSGQGRVHWQPARLPAPPPIFVWPPRPLAVLRFFFGYPGYLFPRNVVHMGLAFLTWLYLTPELSRMATFQLDWIALIYARNLCLLVAIAGGLHLLLYVRRAQGHRYKYHPRWLSPDGKPFLFRNQVRDNVFWSLASGCTVWTAYEVVTLWAYANHLLPTIDFQAQPLYFVLLMCAVSFWHGIHFYWTHRLLHWKPFYAAAHHVHHRNVNIGPWSGLSMHPLEHVIYFSGVLLYWIIAAHPIVAVFHLQYTGLVPSQGHSGFDRIELGRRFGLDNGSYFHYLHHRYFRCNYGPDNGGILPFDKWFGSFHDGTPEAHAALTARLRRR